MKHNALPERDLFGARPHEYPIGAYPHIAKCGSCGADMIWIKTKAGHAMPLSAKTIEERDGQRFALPHFIDCPDAKEWSKR